MRRFSTSFLQGNIARELGEFGVAFFNGTLGEGPARQVLKQTALFNTDAMICGLSALYHRANAPVVLRKEALNYPDKKGAILFASNQRVKIEKAVLAASAAVREWDANGTNFGYYANDLARQAGEFGHNDYYPVCIGAAHVNKNLTGKDVLKAMVLLDEVRGRLAEVFSLKTYAIDHVLHGGIGSVVAYGVLLGLKPQEIESALGILIGHYIPYRATRQGHLSDSKGSAAAFISECAINSVHRASLGFVGPSDIFNNPKAIFMTATGIKEKCPFQLTLTHTGKDFAINQMHFKLGIYEHQSAGAIHALLQLINQNPQILKEKIESIEIFLYEPAYSIIADPSKRVPKTRQTADHSMYFIIAQLLNKCIKSASQINATQKLEQIWAQNMLCPEDYDDKQLQNQDVLSLIQKISVQQGGPEFDKDYPKGIPTKLSVRTDSKTYQSEYCLFPAGHALNKEHDLELLLKAKWYNFANKLFSSEKEFEEYIQSLSKIGTMSNRSLRKIYEVKIEGL